jgi:hypothetical protein
MDRIRGATSEKRGLSLFSCSVLRHAHHWLLAAAQKPIKGGTGNQRLSIDIDDLGSIPLPNSYAFFFTDRCPYED